MYRAVVMNLEHACYIWLYVITESSNRFTVSGSEHPDKLPRAGDIAQWHTAYVASTRS